MPGNIENYSNPNMSEEHANISSAEQNGSLAGDHQSPVGDLIQPIGDQHANAREITQTDHINKRLLESFLVHLNHGPQYAQESNEPDEEEVSFEA